MHELDNNYVVSSRYSIWTPEPGCVHSTDRAGGQPSCKCWNWRYHDAVDLLGRNQPTWHLFYHHRVAAADVLSQIHWTCVATGFRQGFIHFWVDSESGQIFIKTSERTSLLIPFVRRTPIHSHTPYFSLRVTWSTFQPQLAAILHTTILVGKTLVRRWIGTSHALQYLPPFFLPFIFSFFPQSLGIISNVTNGTLQPLAAQYWRWNGEG